MTREPIAAAARRRVLLCDSAMGTALQQAGLEPGACGELWNLEHGDVELADAKRRVGARLFLKGNVDPVNTVLLGSPATVRSDALARLRIGAPGSGYILSTACSVPPAAPPENIVVLREAVEEFAAGDER